MIENKNSELLGKYVVAFSDRRDYACDLRLANL
jgi:hypothetical protein